MDTLSVSSALLLILLLSHGTSVSPFTLADLLIDNLASATSINISYYGPGDLRLYGPIPSELGDLTNLKQLVLDNHELTGSIPPELGNLTGLTNLTLTNNSLTGSIPPELGRLHSLTKLKLSENNLTGSVPPELGSLVNLTILELSFNQLSGPIPVEFSNLQSLVNLQMHDNNLTGPLPPELGNLGSLTIMGLQSNQLSGQIPREFGNLTKVFELALHYNRLSGTLPDELGGMTSLTGLNLWNNSLSGPLPSAIGNLSKLHHIFLNNNSLSGPIPASLGNLSQLVFLGLANNSLSGPIPPELGNLPNVTYIGLGQNQLSSTIPPQLGNLSNLGNLDLANNNLTGLIPPELGNLTRLTRLQLNGNRLFGAPPPQLADPPNLALLDLRNNNLSGSVSQEFAARFGSDNLLAGNPLLGVGATPVLATPVPAATAVPPAVTAVPPAVAAVPPAVASPSKSPSPGTTTAGVETPGLTTPPPASTNGSSSGGSPGGIIAGVVAGVVVLALVAVAVGAFLYRKRRHRPPPDADSEGYNQPAPISKGSDSSRSIGGSFFQRQFTLAELRAATDNFSGSTVVGSGAFGTVYRAVLLDGLVVAVKRLDWRSSSQRKFGERSWFVELAALSNARHRNLVQLLGFCIEGDERMLVLEFFSDGSLSKRLRAARDGAPFLFWEERMSVIEGVCRGLTYLHHDIHPPLLHRDIKAANILLRGSEACIADFGLAHLMQDADPASDTTSVIKGTLPYMAPEYLQGGSKFLSTKCDVYAFGVLVLELLSGRACTHVGSGGRSEPLVSAATRLVQEGRGLEIIDPAVWDAFRVPEAESCLQIAIECLQSEPEDRPTMERVNFRLRVLRSEPSASQTGAFDSVYGSGSESPSTTLHGLREDLSRNSAAGRLQPIVSFVEPYNFVTAR